MVFFLQLEHLDWWHQHRHLQDRLKSLLHDWTRDRTELLFRAKAIFGEACAAAESAHEKEEAHEHQRMICQALFNKVLYLRILNKGKASVSFFLTKSGMLNDRFL